VLVLDACAAVPGLERIRVSEDGRAFESAESGKPFRPWGLNYDHDRSGRLLEDYWGAEWSTVVEDFREMRRLGANVVRIHLQVGRFLLSPERPDPTALARLRRLLALAGENGLHLDLTGLGCYRAEEVPGWYETLDEEGRWRAQARFWRAVAAVGAGNPTVFCYDLMNEPILPGVGERASDWLAGELAGKHFVQRLALDLHGRSRRDVARAWIHRMCAAIRAEDADALITVGLIPWALVFPDSPLLFADPEVGADLDFVSVHLYPRVGEVAEALRALRRNRVGKPLLLEETFPLHCSLDELRTFLGAARPVIAGTLMFYWGETPEELEGRAEDPRAVLTRASLRFFQERAGEAPGAPPGDRKERFPVR